MGAMPPMQLAIRHPELFRKIVVASSFYKKRRYDQRFLGWDESCNTGKHATGIKEAYL